MKRIRDKLLVPLDDEFREMLGFLFSITVVFIVGTLALGMYKDGLYKSRVSEILSHAPDIKVQFYEHYAVNHVFPDAELIAIILRPRTACHWSLMKYSRKKKRR
jgi:hypothetical protein